MACVVVMQFPPGWMTEYRTLALGVVAAGVSSPVNGGSLI
jgi:hypothetical protein